MDAWNAINLGMANYLWLIGVYMMWMLAYKMEMSTPPKAFDALVDDIGDTVAEDRG